MKLKHYSEIAARDVKLDGAEGVKIRWLISQADKVPNFVMRMFEVEPGGNTPFHAHEWEHEVYIVEGSGCLVYGKNKEETPFETGTVIYVEPNSGHQFCNRGDGILRFLCLVPASAKG